MLTYSFVAIIYNPHSTGSGKSNAKELADRLSIKLSGQKLECIETEHAGHGEQLAYDIAMKYKTPLIISSSGDGGYSEVINGAMRAQKKGHSAICAVLPSGNANDHSRTLQRQSLVTAIIKRDVSHIDLLHVSIKSKNKTYDRYAHSYIGLGLTSVVAMELNRHRLSAFKEVVIVLKTFYKFQPFQIEVDDTRVTLDSLIFSNIHQMAKVLKLARTSSVRDGKFEVTYFPHGNKWRLLATLAKAALSHSRPQIKTSNYTFKVVKKMPMQLDGEVNILPPKARVEVTIAQKILSTLL